MFRQRQPGGLGSRGTKATELQNNKIWRSGSEWIKDRQSWPISSQAIQTEEGCNEQKKELSLMLIVKDQEVSEENILNVLDIECYSSVEKARRHAALMLQFVCHSDLI